MVCPFPLFHMGAWTMALQQWQARDAVVFATTDPVEICDAIERHRATRVHCLPGIWRRVLEQLDTAGSATARPVVRHDSPTPRPRPRRSSCSPRSNGALPNAGVRVFYGSTEAGTVTSLAARRHVPQAGERRRARRRSPRSVSSTTASSACAGRSLFDGYLDDPEATAAALEDGWYRTGDVVDVDDEGYLSIVGRGARRHPHRWRDGRAAGGGVGARPAHPAVADVAVSGMPDQQWGEVVCAVAVIVAEAGQPVPSLDDLRALLRGPARPVQAAPAGRGGRRDPAHPRHPAGASPCPRRALLLTLVHLALQDRARRVLQRQNPMGVGLAASAGWNAPGREVLLTGIGGQGIQLAAQVLARAALAEGREVQLFGSYGGMMRGGNTEATLVVADGPVESPPTVDHGVVGDRHAPRLLGARRSPGCIGPGSVLLRQLHGVRARRSTASRTSSVDVPATDLAVELGNIMTASMVMVGAYVRGHRPRRPRRARRRRSRPSLPSYRAQARRAEPVTRHPRRRTRPRPRRASARGNRRRCGA